MPSPVLWGDEAIVRERFGAGVSDLRLTRVLYRFDYPFGPADVVEFFRQYYGPATRAFAALDELGQAALRRRAGRSCGARTTPRASWTHDRGGGVSPGPRDARMTGRS